MNFKEVLIDEQGSAVSAFLTFIQQYDLFNNVAACFVEGQDYIYYRSQVKKYISSNYEILSYPCNGKKEVLELKKMLENNCNLKKNVIPLYFVDKDYGIDDVIDGVCYTDYYAVENFYCKKDVVENIVNDIFNINKYHPDYKICMNLYDEKYKIYYKEICKVNAYAFAIRKKEKELRLKRFDFNSLTFNNFVSDESFDNFKMKKVNYSNLKTFFEGAAEISEDEFKDALSFINEFNLRGKWEIKFYIWFLSGLKKSIKAGKNGLSKNKHIKFSFDHLMDTNVNQAIDSNNLKEYINVIFEI